MNPQYDPRIVHLWQDDRRWTLCHLDDEELARWRYNLKPGTTVYLCETCRIESLARENAKYAEAKGVGSGPASRV